MEAEFNYYEDFFHVAIDTNKEIVKLEKELQELKAGKGDYELGERLSLIKEKERQIAELKKSEARRYTVFSW